MAEGSGFALHEDDDILKIIDEKDAKTKSDRSAARIVHEYLQVKDEQFKIIKDIETANITDMLGTLRTIYAEIRKTDGKLYAQYPYKNEQTK